jgi:hypothetical protein
MNLSETGFGRADATPSDIVPLGGVRGAGAPMRTDKLTAECASFVVQWCRAGWSRSVRDSAFGARTTFWMC